MPILLTKTLQGTEYDLYVLVMDLMPITDMNIISVTVKFWESQGHYEDYFLPMLMKGEMIYGDSSTDLPILDSSGILDYMANYNYVEQYLVDMIEYYSGGIII